MDRAKVSELKEQMDANAGSLKFLRELRDQLVAQKRFKEAIPVCKRMLLCCAPKDRRTRSHVWMSLALIYCGIGRMDKALATAKTAKRLDDRLDETQPGTSRNDTDDSRVWSEFAGILLAAHLNEEASSAAFAAKQLDEKNTDAWVCMARASQRLGRTSDADGAYIMALKFCPADNLPERCRLYQSYAEFLREQGRHETAARNERLAEICAQTAMRDFLPPLCGAKPAP